MNLMNALSKETQSINGQRDYCICVRFLYDRTESINRKALVFVTASIYRKRKRLYECEFTVVTDRELVVEMDYSSLPYRRCD